MTENPSTAAPSGKPERLFVLKVNPQLVLDALNLHIKPPQRAVLIYDGYGRLGPVLQDRRVRWILDARRDNPDALEGLGDDDIVIYACTQDDLGLPFVERLHRINRKYFPLWSAQPGGYVFTNTRAREALKAEFEFQKRHGFAKWDFGHHDFANIIQALEITRHLPGCFVEVGCFRGSSAGAVLRYLSAVRRPMSTFFLDVFEGFTYDESARSADAIWHATHATEGFEAVQSRLLSYGHAFDGLKISVRVNNIITDPLPVEATQEGIAVANLDVDLHEAVYAGLHKLAPHIVKNGILIVEDPGHTPLLIGAKYALEKFLTEEAGQDFVPVVMESGQTFLIRK